MKKILMGSSLIIAVAMLAACGGSSNSQSDNSKPPVAQRSLQGKLTMADGQTPLADATVYIADTAGAKSAIARKSVVGVDCQEPDEEYLFAACTDAKGDFTISFDEAIDPKELKAVKGKFTQTIPIDGQVALGSIALPASGEGVPNMVVVKGSYDSMQNVLAKSGYGNVDANGQLIEGTEQFDLVQKDDFYSLFTDLNGKPELYSYDIVFVNCGVNEWNAFPSSPEIIGALRGYVEAGGQLYLTDQAYDYLEQAFPEYIDFEGSAATPASEAERLDDAQVGSGDTRDGQVTDPILRSFLEQACGEGEDNCIDANGMFTIQGMLGGWAVMVGPHKGMENKVKVWVKGDAGVSVENEVRPLTISFQHGKGKVLYTSYHTDNNNESVKLLPQERVLQFLIFE